jgi:hypothetical protein
MSAVMTPVVYNDMSDAMSDIFFNGMSFDMSLGTVRFTGREL